MARESRRRLKEKMASIWQHFDKAGRMCAELHPLFKESDERLGEMIMYIALNAAMSQQMVEEMWKVMWGEVPEEIHPEKV